MKAKAKEPLSVVGACPTWSLRKHMPKKMLGEFNCLSITEVQARTNPHTFICNCFRADGRLLFIITVILPPRLTNFIILSVVSGKHREKGHNPKIGKPLFLGNQQKMD